MTCKIIFDKNQDGSVNKNKIVEVKARNGQPSLLFNTIKKDSIDDLTALKDYAITYTPEFEKWLEGSKELDINGEATYSKFKQFNSQSLPASSDYFKQLEKDFRLRNEDGSRKRYKSENQALSIAKRLNTGNKLNKQYKASVIKVMGEKSDKRVYYAVKIDDRNLASVEEDNDNPDLIKNSAKKYFGDKTTMKSSELLTLISESGKPLSKLATHLLRYVKYNDVDVNLSEGSYSSTLANGKKATATGVYRVGSNKIDLFSNEKYGEKYIERLILHEIIHSLSYNELKNNSEASNELNKLFKYAKNNYKNEINDVYPFTDID